MANPSSESHTYQHKTDEEYFIYFYEEVLKAYLPPRYKTTKLKELPEIDLEKVLDKYFRDKEFDESKVDYDSIKSKRDFDLLLNDFLKTITYFQFMNIRIGNIAVSHHNYRIIKMQLFKYNQEQCIRILYCIKNYDSIETRSKVLLKKRKNIFINVEANSWFLRTLENKYDIENGHIRGLNAFVNALINNDGVKNHILLKGCTQKNIVEYLNVYYKKDLIKNHTKLSNPKKYIKEVDELIKEHLKIKKWAY